MRQMAERFTEVFELQDHIIAAKYSCQPLGQQRKASACGAFGAVAKEGATIALSKENSQCPGGSYYLGFTERRPGLEEFLVEEEHIFESYPQVARFYHYLPQPPTGLRPYVNLCPLEQAEEEPDLAIFSVNGAVAGRLLGLVAYSRTPWRMYPFGATCFSVVTVPTVEGRPEVSFIDISARRRTPFVDTDVLVSLPWHDCEMAHRNIDKSVCGTYEFTMSSVEG